MTVDPVLARRLLDGLVDAIPENEPLDPTWRAVFSRVFRHPFVPGFYLPEDDDGAMRYRFLGHDAEPGRWLELVYSDLPLVTRLDEHARPLSSSSMPSMMLRFLHLLDVRDGLSVLEIGTGSGYNAAVLCERLGSDLVTTVDIDPKLASGARDHLAASGYRPTIAVADGTGGYAARAPYDRILSTGSVSRIPDAWVDQLRPGGVVVTPLQDTPDGGLVALRAQPDGRLEGRLHPAGAAFMALRQEVGGYGTSAQREELLGLVYRAEDGVRRSSTPPDWLDRPWRIGHGLEPMLFIRLRMPDLEWYWFEAPDGRRTVPGVASRDDGSWARLHLAGDGTATVTQGGARRLWDLVEQSLEVWDRLGRPAMGRYGITVSADHSQRMWLDSPDSGNSWRL